MFSIPLRFLIAWLGKLWNFLKMNRQKQRDGVYVLPAVMMQVNATKDLFW